MKINKILHYRLKNRVAFFLVMIYFETQLHLPRANAHDQRRAIDSLKADGNWLY